ncbi:hypothetical protein NDU88_003314 [Pleurodeles waltl]|uniref:Uncharacterized protein n=1 Tax=Pleurodeles waltl TaxID=8319 RepID=A0AAV7NG99_PLEWA|nr:hypothetical protein NDU88_003314 [Pleurodeles waltl]
MPSGRPELGRTASQGQRRPTSRGEINATPAVRAKLRRAALQNDAQPENKQENPRTDPGHLVIPAIHRKRLSARLKTTHDFPAWKITTQVRVCWGEIDAHTIFPHISSSVAI